MKNRIETKKKYSEALRISDVLKDRLKINRHFDLDKTLSFILDDIHEKFGFEGITIFLLNKEKTALKSYKYLVAENVISQEAIDELVEMELDFNSPDGGVAAYVIHKNVHVYAKEIDPNLLDTPQMKRIYELTQIKSNLLMPLEIYGEVLGMIAFPGYTKKVDLSDEEVLKLKDYIKYVSIAISSNFLYNELKESYKIIEEKNNQLKQELCLARKIQNQLIPKGYPHQNEFNIEAIYTPLEEIGGDFFDFINVKEPNLLGLFISDVSGHGVPAALITSMVKALIDTAGESRDSPNELFKYINNTIANQINDNFLTAFYGIFDSENKSFTYSRAAHNPPLLIRNGYISELTGKGKMLGILKDVQYEENTIQLQKGDKMILYTDGLTEAVNSNGDEFEDKLINLLKKEHQIPIKNLMNQIESELKIHCDNGFFDDDICLIGMEIF